MSVNISETLKAYPHLLPMQAQELILQVGLEKTLLLVERLGGVSFPVPHSANKTGEARLFVLTEIVGNAAAETIAKAYGGTKLYIPNCKDALRRVRNIAMVTEFDERRKAGETATEIVFDLTKRYRMADRRIWDIVNSTTPEQWDDPAWSQNKMQLSLIS